MVLDGLVFALIVAFAYFWRLDGSLMQLLPSGVFWAILGTLLSCLYIFGNYDLDREESFLPFFVRLVMALAMTLMMAVLLNYILGTDKAGLFGRGVLLGSLFLYFLLSVFWRLTLWSSLKGWRSAARVLIFTENRYREFLEKELKKNKFPGQWVWILKDPEAGEYSWSDYEQAFKESWSAWLIAAPLEMVEKELGQVFLRARFSGVRIMDLSRFYEDSWKKVPVFHLGTSWFFLNEGFALIASRTQLRLKRLMDILISGIFLLVLWPVMVITALLVKLESAGPAVYRQTRTGKDGEDFVIYKFRSMTVNAESQGAQWAQKNDVRVTKVGKFIRLTRLDELPQLWNVLKGDMSFIGPRPERPEFNGQLSQQIPYYNLRHLVRPGITGWAQILYPYGASVEDAQEKLQFDLFYIKNFSFLLDFQIVLKTISVVILGKGR